MREIKFRGKRVDNIHFGYEYPIPEVLEVIGNIWDTPELINTINRTRVRNGIT